jgi:hypothetical protein
MAQNFEDFRRSYYEQRKSMAGHPMTGTEAPRREPNWGSRDSMRPSPEPKDSTRNDSVTAAPGAASPTLPHERAHSAPPSGQGGSPGVPQDKGAPRSPIVAEGAEAQESGHHPWQPGRH